MRRLWLIAVALGSTLASTASASAQAAPTADEALLRELAAIRSSLERLSAQIEALGLQQELDVLVRRVELKQQRMMPIESELREARNEDKRLAQELEKLDLLETQWREELSDRRGLESEENAEQTERQLTLLRQRRETLETRAVGARQRVIELENRLEDTRREIDALEALVDERLDLR